MFQDTKDLQVTSSIVHPCLDKWRSIVAYAEANGTFAPEEVRDACFWDNCAVGEAHAKYPTITIYAHDQRYMSEVPKDVILHDLGKSFYEYVATDNFEMCNTTLDQIEARLGELVKTNAYA